MKWDVQFWDTPDMSKSEMSKPDMSKSEMSKFEVCYIERITLSQLSIRYEQLLRSQHTTWPQSIINLLGIQLLTGTFTVENL